MHSWDPLLPWFSASDKFSPIAGGVPTPATIFPLLWEDHVNNHVSLGVPPRTRICEPHVKSKSFLANKKVSSPSTWSTLCQVKSRMQMHLRTQSTLHHVKSGPCPCTQSTLHWSFSGSRPRCLVQSQPLYPIV